MKNIEYDFEKETDKDFLRAAGKMLQDEVIKLRIRVVELELQKSEDEDIKSKLTGELLVLRRRIFDSKQEKKDRLKKLKKDKKKKKANLVHNQNENKNSLEASASEIELESKEVEHEREDNKCPHCSDGELKELDGLFEESTEYDVNTTYYLLKRHKRKKYKCGTCGKIETAKGPDKLKAGSQFSVQLATKVAVDKFNRHLPLERQRVMMKESGVNVSAKTLFSLTEHLYQLLLPLEQMNRNDVLKGHYTCMDESPMSFFNPHKASGYVWSLSNQIGVHYQFEPSRSKAVAQDMIKGYRGVVVTDGLASYGFLTNEEGIIHAYCWSHLRRYFFDAMAENDKAGAVVDFIDKLYEIEHEARSFDELKVLRQNRSTKVYEDIKSWMDENEGHYLKESTLTGKAIKYFYNQQQGLEHFLKNEFVPLDNNMAERRQRCPVMGRKNYLAFRSINGADVGMFFYSMIESCKTNGIDPSSYLQTMALRAIRKEELESPYRYASRLKAEVAADLQEQLSSSSLN